jgi:hypothetical protein
MLQLSQAAMKSTRMIADNVTQWRRAADGLRLADFSVIQFDGRRFTFAGMRRCHLTKFFEL